ncbi:MAG: class I SAM-dependent methyltransferase [Acidobacteriota bacterium]|nr:class I SAM-dependent methyltransferase [Acidobacteriota bacterium]
MIYLLFPFDNPTEYPRYHTAKNYPERRVHEKIMKTVSGGQTMAGDSIKAYDIPQRIAHYDMDMDIMHPNRHKMAEMALAMLPFPREVPLRILDLGVGTGFLSLVFLRAYPHATVLAVDGAASMIHVANARFGDIQNRVDFRVGDFRALNALLEPNEMGNLVISCYALHHLNKADKTEVLKRAVQFLKPGGWLLNADLIIARDAQMERHYQDMRARGIVTRASADDERFANVADTRRFLKELEINEGDQPLTLQQDLELLAQSGLSQTDVFWLETREALTGGWK